MITDEIAADLLELEDEIPTTFTWNGASYACVTGSTRRTRNLEPGGFGLEAGLVIFVRASLFTTRPTSRERLTFENATWRIDDVTQVAGSPFLRLLCNDPAQS